MRDPKGNKEYSGAVSLTFLILSLIMMLPMFWVSNAASITFLILGICLFIGTTIWIPMALYDEEMSWAFLFEVEKNVSNN